APAGIPVSGSGSAPQPLPSVAGRGAGQALALLQLSKNKTISACSALCSAPGPAVSHAVACGHHLHTPMFFLLLNLALTDLGSICTTVPKAMHNSLWDTRTISDAGGAAQVFLLFFFMGAEYFLLTIMCSDRYVSICKPLHHGTLLGSRACAHMAAAAWARGFLYSLLHTANTFSLPL
ncbi:unnamed protein product, partial [Coccothraustes coccothraustes]